MNANRRNPFATETLVGYRTKAVVCLGQLLGQRDPKGDFNRVNV